MRGTLRLYSLDDTFGVSSKAFFIFRKLFLMFSSREHLTLNLGEYFGLSRVSGGGLLTKYSWKSGIFLVT